MVRLVTCDLDGTLLPHGQWVPSDELFPLIHRLHACGVAFAAASGRQYHSLRKLFAPVADDIYFICENGAMVYHGDRLLSKTKVDTAVAHDLIADIVAVEDAEVMISGESACYLIPKTEDFVHHIRDVLHFETVLVSHPADIPEPIIKISACRQAGAAPLYPHFAPAWEHRFNMAIAGHEWLDFTLSDKGTGLDVLCEALHIAPADVMSFGDNYNDLPLLEKVGYPYIMETACDDLRGRFSLHCRRVEDTLSAFLATAEEKFSQTP